MPRKIKRTSVDLSLEDAAKVDRMRKTFGLSRAGFLRMLIASVQEPSLSVSWKKATIGKVERETEAA